MRAASLAQQIDIELACRLASARAIGFHAAGEDDNDALKASRLTERMATLRLPQP
jgi:hypothetical protein